MLDHFTDDMPLTRCIRQRLEEDEQLDKDYCSGGNRADNALQLDGKGAQKGHISSFALAADGSSAALLRSEDATFLSETVAATGPAVLRSAALAARETSKQAQHGARSGRDGASAAQSSELNSDSASRQHTDDESRPSGPALCCRVTLPNETQQSPMLTRSQDLSEADFVHLSSSTREARLRSTAELEGIHQQHFCEATLQPSSNTQQPKSPRVRHHRISLTIGATDGGSTTSQSTAVATLKSCIRKESTIRYGARLL